MTGTLRAARTSALLLFTAALAGQHAPAPPRTPEPGNTAATRATHAPQPKLPPLVAWLHVQLGNRAFVHSREACEPPPPLEPRPAGAGRYVCAVLICADADFAVAERLGLLREDVLELRVPGPFVSPETTALLARVVRDERLSLILVLGHDDCRSLAADAADADDALGRRVRALQRDAARHGESLERLLLLRQSEQLLAASAFLRDQVDADELRVLPGLCRTESGAIVWQHRRAQGLPLAPVK